MARRRGSSRGARRSGLSSLLERVSQSLDRFSAALEAAMAHGNAATSSAGDAAVVEGPLLGVDPTALTGGAHGPLDAAAAASLRRVQGELPGAGQASFAALAGAAMASPSEGLAPLQGLARDTATGSRQLEQIRIAREQLAEQKKTNQHLERQQSSSPAVFGP